MYIFWEPVSCQKLNHYFFTASETLQGYLAGTWYLTALPQALNPFRNSEASINLFLTYDENKESCYFAEKDDKGNPIDREDILQIQHTELSDHERGNLWLIRDYHELLEQYAEKQGLSQRRISLRFGELSFVERDNAEYCYNDQLGLLKV